jgi:ribosomal-protein-alanine N-acetyltransferase
MQWVLSRMAPADIESLIAIEAQCFDAPWGRLSFEAEFASARAHSLVARTCGPEAEPRVIAYICFRLLADELHLFRIAVAPQWRGRGVASRLLAECLDTAGRQGATSVLLEVRPSNRAALALYRKFGFEVIAVRPNYYPESREDALMLQKPVAELAASHS